MGPWVDVGPPETKTFGSLVCLFPLGQRDLLGALRSGWACALLDAAADGAVGDLESAGR